MAASSPTSVTNRPRGAGFPQTGNAPSGMLPLRFILTGLMALCVGLGWLVARPDILATYHYNQYVIALTHLFVLGWLGTVVMGAMYQLVPVALETKLHSERMARWQFVFHVVGVAGMVWMFWIWDMKQVGHFGSALAVGVGLFVYNIARTLMRVPRWNIVGTAVASGLLWLSLTILAGLSIAASKCTYESADKLAVTSFLGAMIHGLRSVAMFMARFDQMSAMHAHAHLGVVGFFVMLIVGISYKLVPMFTLSEVQSSRRAAWSVALLNLGLAGLFVTILVRSPLKFAFAFVVIAGLAIYGWELRAILHARKRRTLDWALKYFLTAVSLLAAVAAMAVVLSWPGLPLNARTGQLENAYGFLGLIGVATFAILGMLYKIVPFQVWFHTYSRQIGRSKGPALAEMYSERWQAAGYWLFVSGLIVTSPAIFLGYSMGVRVGCSLLVLGTGTFVVNVAKILWHLHRPQIEPLKLKPQPPPALPAATIGEKASSKRTSQPAFAS